MSRGLSNNSRRKTFVLVLVATLLSAGMVGVSAVGPSINIVKADVRDDSMAAAGVVESVELAVDDGSFETAIGLTLGGTVYAVNRLTPPSYPAVLTDVKIAFRAVQFGAVSGDPLRVLAGAHENGADSIDLTAFQVLDSIVPTLGSYATFDVPDITINSGDFVVGFRLTHLRGQFPIALDSTTPFSQRSYVSTNGITFLHIESANLVLIGNFGIRAKVNVVRTPPPSILNVAVAGKKLLVTGENFDVGAAIMINGLHTKKVFNDEENPTTLLIARKAGRDIEPGQMITVQVQNACGLLSNEFKFTRPL